MNEIERFKKSRMIPKGGNGLQVGTKGKRGTYPVEYTNRGWVYSNTGNPVTQKDIPSIVIDKPNPPQTRKGLGTGTLNGRDVVTTGFGWKYADTGEQVNGREFTNIHATNQDDIRRDNVASINQAIQGTTGETPAATNHGSFSFTPLFAAPWNTPAASTDQAVQETPTDQENIFPYRSAEDKRASEQQARQQTRTRGGGRRTRAVRPREDYAANFAGMNFTDDERKFITEAGFDPTNARSVQEFILKQTGGKANLGARKGAGIADGYWGKESIKAFNALRSYGTFAPKVDAQEPVKPVSETPVDAPDFGYATNQDYSNGRQFKGLGFNNYQGLLLYAQNSQDQFAKDLRQRFGNRLTDQNYVESQLGISGKYRGGNAGDFGDMARSMQAWKTGVNNEFDKRRADYAQARLAERTGSDGIVYSSPEMMKKFEGIKVSPEVRFGGNKFDFSNMKFNLNFGNTGTNTLGDAGQGSMGNIDNLSPRMKFAMGL